MSLIKDSMGESVIDYNTFFKHVQNLKKVLLVGTGRSGTDFFQSLLDGHSEILQVTGIWVFHGWWQKAMRKENPSDLINEFIWSTSPGNNLAKFKSYHNKIERWDQLGRDKNEFFEVDIDTFKDNMMCILADRELNSKNFFLAVNLAYGLATGVDIKKTKIIFYHIHRIEHLKEFKKDFSDFEVICTIRDPRNALVSGMEHFKKYDVRLYNTGHLSRLLNRLFEESEPILEYTKKIKILKLEDLCLFSEQVLNEFCMMYGLRFEDGMLESSYHGKKWWGDAVSGRYLNGFNKNIRNKKWKNVLFFYDNLLIEFILEDRLRHYGYPIENRMSVFLRILALFLVFLPMKYELKIFVHSFRNRKGARGKVGALKHTVISYIYRVFLYFRLIWKKNRKKIFLADFFFKGEAL